MQSDIRAVAVFCGSSAGVQPAHIAAAEALGRDLAAAGVRLVYGGGRVGLMGAVAGAALAAGGTVIGVIPRFLQKWEVAHEALSELVIVESMHERKQRMFELADGFVMLPGGLGTLDETIEIITWRQLKLHDKPVVLCNVDGSATPLLALIDAAVHDGFARSEVRRLYRVAQGVEEVLPLLQRAPAAPGGAVELM